MSINSETCQLTFPWDGVLPKAETVIIRDIEVVGVGAKRRRQIEDLQKTKNIILQTHESQIPESVQSIYNEELLRTLQWLRPLKTESAAKIDLHLEQQNMFSKMFPRTAKALGLSAIRVRDNYLKEMDWSSWLLQDHWRYFVGFLRLRFPQQKQVVDLAYWEWVHAWLEMQPFDLNVKSEPGILALNPTLQIVPLLETNAILEKTQGMYSFLYNPEENRVIERPLQAPEALLLDLMQEDRKFSFSQLVEMAVISEDQSAQLSKENWEKVLKAMLEDQILFLGN